MFVRLQRQRCVDGEITENYKRMLESNTKPELISSFVEKIAFF